MIILCYFFVNILYYYFPCLFSFYPKIGPTLRTFYLPSIFVSGFDFFYRSFTYLTPPPPPNDHNYVIYVLLHI